MVLWHFVALAAYFWASTICDLDPAMCPQLGSRIPVSKRSLMQEWHGERIASFIRIDSVS